MPDGAIGPGQGFFGGLATGIFDSMNERRLESQQREDQERKQSLSFLTSLMDQVEPESRPFLIKQIGDVMGLKGKQRGFWDRLTGGGLEGGREAIQGRTQDILGSLVGPQEGRQLRPHPAEVALEPGMTGSFQLMQPGAQQAPATTGLGMTPDLTQGKLIMRDPRTEALDELKARYGIQARAGFEKLEEQQRLMGERQTKLQEDRQRHDLEVLDYKADLKAKSDIAERAHQIAISQGRVRVMPADEQQAALQLISEQGMTESLRKALLGLRGAQQTRTETETQALQADPLTGIAPGKPMTATQKQTADTLQQQRAQSKFEDFTRSNAQVKSLDQQIQSEEALTSQVAAGFKLKYDPTTGKITNEDGSPAGAAAYILAPRLKQLNDLKAKRTQAQVEMEGHRGDLRTKFSTYYETDPATGEITPKTGFGGVSPTGAPRTPGVGQTFDATAPRTSGPSSQVSMRLKVGDTWNYTSTTQRQVGDVIKIPSGIQYKILQVLELDEGGKFTYKIKRIR